MNKVINRLKKRIKRLKKDLKKTIKNHKVLTNKSAYGNANFVLYFTEQKVLKKKIKQASSRLLLLKILRQGR